VLKHAICNGGQHTGVFQMSGDDFLDNDAYLKNVLNNIFITFCRNTELAIGIINSIKVDREERPDIDHVYISVCQLITGQGGWPLTIFMTPDKKLR